MAFKENVKQWWKRVGGNGDAEQASCEARIYSEQHGFRKCGARPVEIHHIDPESKLIEEGQNPNGAVGLPLCRQHHRGRGIDLPYEANSTMHNDMGEAHEAYRRGDKDAYKKASRRHHEMVRRGERITGGDEGSDRTYTDLMERKAMRYVLEHPEDKKPEVKPTRRKHWTDGLF